MRYKPLKLSGILFLFGLAGAQAQESANASGGDASGSGGSVSWSIGQVAYQTPKGTTGSITEGVQQPYEIFAVTGIEEAKHISLSVSVFPNPATDYLILTVDEFALSNLSCQLYDLNGRLLSSRKIKERRTSIAMESLGPATYFIKVVRDNRQIKTFKIIKN